MNLPADIAGLVIKYNIKLKLAKWVNQSDIMHTHPECYGYAIDIPDVVGNPSGFEYMMEYLSSSDPIKMKCTPSGNVYNMLYRRILRVISLSDIPNVINLIKWALDKSKLLVGEIDDYMINLACTKYGYKWALEQLPKNLLSLHASSGIGTLVISNLLKIHTEPIPELIKIFKDPAQNLINGQIELLAANPHMFDIFIEKTRNCPMEKYSKMISSNTSADSINFLIRNPELVDTERIMGNPSAYLIIRDILVKHNYKLSNPEASSLCTNPNPHVIDLIRNNLELIRPELSRNSTNEALDILFENPDLIDLKFLVANTNPRVIPILKANYILLNKRLLATNPVIFTQVRCTSKFISRVEKLLIDDALGIIKGKEEEIKKIKLLFGIMG